MLIDRRNDTSLVDRDNPGRNVFKNNLDILSMLIQLLQGIFKIHGHDIKIRNEIGDLFTARANLQRRVIPARHPLGSPPQLDQRNRKLFGQIKTKPCRC
ncbi:hypothetical protein D3C72_1593010 [compost metagenome]